jgi:cytochrome c biogenesis protein CcmG/thiol:disulfide interchange protein DsbE
MSEIDVSANTNALAPETSVQQKKKRNPGVIAAIVLGAIMLVFLGWRLRDVGAARPVAGDPAPNINMAFFDGYEWQGVESADLNDMRGKVVIVNFWASWCVECRIEADLLEQTWQRYKDQDVVMLGIAYTDLDPDSHRYLEEFNVTYPNAPDLQLRASDDYGITGVPETFFIDRDGVVQHVKLGPVSQSEMDSLINRLLNQ